MCFQFMLTDMTQHRFRMNNVIRRKIFAGLCNIFPFIQTKAERESAEQAALGLLSLSEPQIIPGTLIIQNVKG